MPPSFKSCLASGILFALLAHLTIAIRPAGAQAPSRFLGAGWRTDWDRRTVNLEELEVNVPRDAIPSIDEPEFVDVDDPRLAAERITMTTRVIGYVFEGEARAYPVPIMNRHEIVNDTFGDTHLAVAW